jgi:hypothetical protein
MCNNGEAIRLFSFQSSTRTGLIFFSDDSPYTCRDIAWLVIDKEYPIVGVEDL